MTPIIMRPDRVAVIWMPTSGPTCVPGFLILWLLTSSEERPVSSCGPSAPPDRHDLATVGIGGDGRRPDRPAVTAMDAATATTGGGGAVGDVRLLARGARSADVGAPFIGGLVLAALERVSSHSQPFKCNGYAGLHSLL